MPLGPNPALNPLTPLLFPPRGPTNRNPHCSLSVGPHRLAHAYLCSGSATDCLGPLASSSNISVSVPRYTAGWDRVVSHMADHSQVPLVTDWWARWVRSPASAMATSFAESDWISWHRILIEVSPWDLAARGCLYKRARLSSLLHPVFHGNRRRWWSRVAREHRRDSPPS
jgi:hypothetical protein